MVDSIDVKWFYVACRNLKKQFDNKMIKLDK
jgi:hypothetical protein